MATTIPTSDVGPFSHHLKKIHIPPSQPEPPASADNDQFTPSTRQILDRWAARQARDMINSIERRAHQAELSALCTSTRPVSARAATFLSDTSPSGSSEGSMNLDVGPNVRARNLIQMWREMEAEAGSPQTPGRGGEQPERKVVAREGSGKFGSEKGGGSSLVRMRCRREMEDLVDKMMKEREKEVSGLAEMGKVSRFSHRGRIQSMLKLRFLRKDLAFQNEPIPFARRNRNKSLESLQSGVTILFLKERFNNQNKTNNHDALNKDKSKAQLPILSQDSCTSQQEDHMIDNNEHQEVISIEDPEGLPSEITTPQSICEENIVNHDELSPRSPSPELESVHSEQSEKFESPSPKLDESWDERNVWASNIDWNRNPESPSTQNWQSDSEVVTEEIEPYTPNEIVGTAHDWMNNSYITWRGWGENSQEYYDYFETFSDNVEIRELLQRRRVTTSLQSDFCRTMNKMIMSFLDKQEQEYVDENFPEEYAEKQNWNINCEFNDNNQAASDSSLVPFSCNAVNYTNNWQLTTPFTHRSSHNLPEMENVDDMKNEMAKMREEISELKKMLKSCMEWQSKIQDTIKYEVSSAIRQSVSVVKSSESLHTQNQEKCCCICHEMKVDCLLYRCGHMCTCFKCANELHWRNGTCPICDAAIDDVVRAHPDT